jgi:hypothetical protein
MVRTVRREKVLRFLQEMIYEDTHGFSITIVDTTHERLFLHG